MTEKEAEAAYIQENSRWQWKWVQEATARLQAAIHTNKWGDCESIDVYVQAAPNRKEGVRVQDNLAIAARRRKERVTPPRSPSATSPRRSLCWRGKSCTMQRSDCERTRESSADRYAYGWRKPSWKRRADEVALGKWTALVYRGECVYRLRDAVGNRRDERPAYQDAPTTSR